MNEQHVQKSHEKPAAGKKRLAISVFRWVWLLFVFGGSGYYLTVHGETFLDNLRALSFEKAFMSVALLLAAKYFVSESARLSLDEVDIQYSRKEMYYVYAVSDAAKYLPGGVWGLVGRFGMYSLRQIPIASSLKAMALENAWLIISSVFIGLIFSIDYFEYWFIEEASFHLSDWMLVVGGGIALILWTICLWFFTVAICRKKQEISTVLKVVGLHSVIGLLLGLHFAVLTGSSDLVLLSIGIFAIARALGYLSFFAPAGIGVREVVIVVMLANWVDTDHAIFLAAASRILTVVSELGTLPVVTLVLRPKASPAQ